MGWGNPSRLEGPWVRAYFWWTFQKRRPKMASGGVHVNSWCEHVGWSGVRAYIWTFQKRRPKMASGGVRAYIWTFRKRRPKMASGGVESSLFAYVDNPVGRSIV
jgi:hypothetical protein